MTANELTSSMLEALEFYANPENWKEQKTGIEIFPSEVDKDNGDRAREALKTTLSKLLEKGM